MARPLRELFAEFKLKITGAEKLRQSNKELDKSRTFSEKARAGIKRLVNGYKALEKVINTVQKLVNILNILKGLGGLNRRVEKNANRTARAMRGVTSASSKMNHSMGGLLTTLRNIAIIGISVRFIQNLTDMGDAIEKVSQQVGLSVREFQAYSHAAAIGGVEQAEFANALGQLQRRANDAAGGSAESAEAFRQLGVDVKDTNGELLGGSELLKRVAEGLKNTENPTLRTALSMELMGRNGRKMLPMLTSGRKGIEDMAKELERLGGGLSEDAVLRSAEFKDELQRLKVTMTSVFSEIGVVILPILSWIAKKFQDLTIFITKVSEKSEIFKAIIITLTGALLGLAFSMAPILAPFILFAGLITAVILLVDDLLVGMKGGKSVIADFLNKILGGEKGTQTLIALGIAFKGIIDNIKNGVPITESLQRAFIGLIARGDDAGEFGSKVINSIQKVISVFRTFIAFTSIVIDKISSAFDWIRRLTIALSNMRGMLSSFSKLGAVLGHLPVIGELFDRTTPSVQPMTGGTVTTTNRNRNRTNINAGVTVGSITVNDATDTAAVQQQIDQSLRHANEQQARQLQGALVQDIQAL